MTEHTTHPPGVGFNLNQRVIYIGTAPEIQNDPRVQYSGRVSKFSDQHPDEVAVHWGPEESLFRWERRADLAPLPCTIQVVVGEGAQETWFETGRTLRQIRLAVNAMSVFENRYVTTNSLFVLREICLRFGDQVKVTNLDTGLTGHVDEVGELEMLQEELNQSQRYLNSNA